MKKRMQKKKSKTDYLVAIRVGNKKAAIYAFPTKTARASFINIVAKKYPQVQFATSEVVL